MLLSMAASHRRTPPRLERIFQKYDPALYFVTMVTWQRRPILACESVHKVFVARAQKQARLDVAVGRYVLMPDHVHCFIRVAGEQTLSRSVKHLKESITKALRADEPGLRVWQPGFFDRLLRADESYAEKWSTCD